jgi:beta-lactamase superfamily II metal-dependent hydrolase
VTLEISVISYGANNRFEHPSADVVGRVASYVLYSMMFETAQGRAI